MDERAIWAGLKLERLGHDGHDGVLGPHIVSRRMGCGGSSGTMSACGNGKGQVSPGGCVAEARHKRTAGREAGA